MIRREKFCGIYGNTIRQYLQSEQAKITRLVAIETLRLLQPQWI